MNKKLKNIDNIRKDVKVQISDLLWTHGYTPNKEKCFVDDQALILQWTNKVVGHSFQLVWDNKERWFCLSEFHKTNNLNHIESIQIDLFPYSSFTLMPRQRYDKKYLDRIKSKIEHNIRK